VVKKGRYGPYVSHAGVNATLPSDVTPEQVTLAQAVELINARAGGKKGATTGGAPRARRTTPRRAKPATAPTPAAVKKPKAVAKPVAKKKKAAK
jgi:DNA topoisomerase-1